MLTRSAFATLFKTVVAAAMWHSVFTVELPRLGDGRRRTDEDTLAVLCRLAGLLR